MDIKLEICKIDALLTRLWQSDKESYRLVKGLLDEAQSLQKQLDEERALEKPPHIVTYKDFTEMLSTAVPNLVQAPMPMKISQRAIDFGHAAHVVMIEAFIGYANRNGLLRKLINFDYRR